EVLANGIVVLVAERPAVPIVAVRVLTRAGAVYDPADRAGLANLTGAVLTRGTAKRTGPELDSAIEFVGGSVEAGTGRDTITVSMTAQKKDLALGLDLVSEVVLTPTFPEAEVARKVSEIQAAIKRSEEDPGKRELTQTTIMFGRQAIVQTDPDYFPMAVASYVLGGGSASRLYTRVREESGLAYAVFSWVAPWRHGASFAVSAQTRTAEAPKVVAMIREELARMGREPVADRELALAKQYLIGSFPLRLDTSGKVAD